MLHRCSRTALPAALGLGVSLALGLGLTLGFPATLRAQPGPGLSSGSGQGTGTGASAGVQPNTSGSVSGVGPGPSTGGTGLGGAGGVPLPVRPVPPEASVPLGPGATTNFPDDSVLFPFTNMTPIEGDKSGNLSAVSPSLLEEARRLDAPGDRSLALQRVANAAIFSNQLALAHTALGEAAQAAVLEPTPLVHDQRLIAIISSYMNLAEAHLREGKVDLSLPELNSDPNAAPAPKEDRTILIRRAGAEWQRAAALAGLILNPTYRSEMLYRVIDSMAYGSQTIINDFPGQNEGSAGTNGSYGGLADQILRDGAAYSRRIERPVWRDRALVSLAAAAAASRQFARGLEIARMIPQPEVCTDALVRLAEAQARRGDPKGATTSYHEAALAVASIPLDDPRAVLAGVLIDNLISVGRFDDARATIVLYPDTARRMIALGAIAESQGRRGAADSAKAWIDRDVSPQYRAQLLRRVLNGVLLSIESNRSRDLGNRER